MKRDGGAITLHRIFIRNGKRNILRSLENTVNNPSKPGVILPHSLQLPEQMSGQLKKEATKPGYNGNNCIFLYPFRPPGGFFLLTRWGMNVNRLK